MKNLYKCKNCGGELGVFLVQYSKVVSIADVLNDKIEANDFYDNLYTSEFKLSCSKCNSPAAGEKALKELQKLDITLWGYYE